MSASHRAGRTGFATHELLFWYDHGPSSMFLRRQGAFMQPFPHVESPESKGRVRNLIEASSFIDNLLPVPVVPASETELLRVHTHDYLDRVAELSAGWGGDSGSGAWVPNGGERILKLAAGCARSAAFAVADGIVDNAYALIRPPGHHAEADAGYGFCVFNNAAVSAAALRAERGLDRIAIIDWDVHHGNGTESIFWDEPNVLAISIHQDGLYPAGRGAVDHLGGSHAEGATLNIPLPSGCGHEAYLAVADRILEPALRRFRPDMILIGCGFDSAVFDPLGRMLCHTGTYHALVSRMMACADDLCGGRLVILQEGGYGPVYGAHCGLAVVEALTGIPSGVPDPFLFVQDYPDQTLRSHQQAAIEAAAANLARVSAPIE